MLDFLLFLLKTVWQGKMIPASQLCCEIKGLIKVPVTMPCSKKSLEIGIPFLPTVCFSNRLKNIPRLLWVVKTTSLLSLVQEDPTCNRAKKPMCLKLMKLVCSEPGSATREAAATRSLYTTAKSSPHYRPRECLVQQQRPSGSQK